MGRLFAVVRYSLPELTIRQHFIGCGYVQVLKYLRSDISKIYQNCGLLPVSISVESLPL